MRSTRDDRAVLPLGWALHVPTDEQLDAVRETPTGMAFATLRRHKVLVQAWRRLAGTGLPLAGLLREETLPQRRQQLTLPDTWRVLEEIGAGAGYRPALMKGVAARLWYPDPALRHLGDLDVWLPGQADAWHLCRNLMRYGWRLNGDELPWVKATGAGDEYGVINMVSTRPDRHDVDIHFGHYSVRHCAWIPLTAGRVADDSGRPPRLADEDNLAVILANAAGDHAIGLKDVNDILLAAGRGAALDWERVRHLLGFAGLREFAAAFVRTAARLYAGAPREPESLAVIRRELGGARRPERVPDGTGSTWLRRSATVRHAWRVGLRDGVRSAALSAGTAAVYYCLPLRPRLVRWAGGPVDGVIRDRSPRRCVRLVPLQHLARLAGLQGPPARLDPVAHGGIAWRQAAGIPYADNAGAILLPTVYGRLSLSRVRALTAALSGPASPIALPPVRSDDAGR
ncbi:hypothetical protein GCM10009850_122400 [Nonomuraea monospora]|uniref:Nucleotidyltransferase family protein n=1 Tax=Nonomuraea monospora TaxID=568818 RepID=A0ABN3D637_9ACTN